MSLIHEPLHPGEIVKDALFTDTDLTIGEAAKRLQINRTTLSRLINGHSCISADMAYRLSLLLNTSPELLLNIQKDYDLWLIQSKNQYLHIEPLSAHCSDNNQRTDAH